jgi:hypothetical protein
MNGTSCYRRHRQWLKKICRLALLWTLSHDLTYEDLDHIARLKFNKEMEAISQNTNTL